MEKQSVDELKRELGSNSMSRYYYRITTVLLIEQGEDIKALSKSIQVTEKTIYNWVNIFKKEGLSGLKEKKRHGRPKKLSTKEITEITELINSPPELYDVKLKKWTGEILSKFIEKEYNIILHEKTCDILIKKLKI